MIRPVMILSALVFASAPGLTATYSARLAVPTTQRIIARDIVWACGADACQGSTAESRPVVICESLAKSGGKVDAFLVDGRAFTPAELATCNASAKRAAAQALAAQ